MQCSIVNVCCWQSFLCSARIVLSGLGQADDCLYNCVIIIDISYTTLYFCSFLGVTTIDSLNAVLRKPQKHIQHIQ